MSASPIFSYTKIDKTITLNLPKSFLIALLASFFSMSFILSDYWNIPESTNIKFLVLGITILLGVAWCLLSAGELVLKINIKPSLSGFILLMAIITVNLPSLITSIPWRGDEDHHINKALHLMERIPLKIFVILIVVWLFILLLSLLRPRLALISGSLFLLLLIITYINNEPIASLRYPFISYWFISIPPLIFSIPFDPYHEFLFRIMPLISVILLSLYFLHNLPNKNKAISLIWALSISFMPIIFYYASILYLELPAVLLMTIVCFNIDKLVQSDFLTLKKHFAWYALLLIGFIKETLLPFIICFLFVRLIYRLWIVYFKDRSCQEKNINFGKNFLILIKSELIVVFSALIPCVFYLELRNLFSVSRRYSPNFQNLLDFELYGIYVRSFIEQFGLFIVFFLIGCFILYKRKKHISLIFLSSLVCFFIVFFMLDEKIYEGYSRFNLAFLAPITTASYYFIKESHRYWKISLAFSVITIVTSFSLSPINIDGSKQPYWGNYLTDTSEHYYPTREALTWIKTTYPEDNLLVAGLYYPYYFDFYFDKLEWCPDKFEVLYSNIDKQEDASNLSDSLKIAKENNFDHILFFVLNSELPKFDNDIYEQEIVFSNMSHNLVYISKSKSGDLNEVSSH